MVEPKRPPPTSLSPGYFASGDGLRWVSTSVVEATVDRLRDALVEAARSCEPQSDLVTGGVSDPTFVATSVDVSVVDGPDVGDDALWLETDVTVETSADYLLDDAGESGAANSVLVRDGDYVFSVAATGAPQETVAKYAALALE